MSDQKFLDIDHCLLEAIFRLALSKVQICLHETPTDLSFIGIHATFRWRHRIVTGARYASLKQVAPSGFLNVVDDLACVMKCNNANPKWKDSSPPDAWETNAWIMEEEYVTQVLADVFEVPFAVIGRRHRLPNLADLFSTDKPKVYLSYPITAIREDNPDLLKEIEIKYVPEIGGRYVVFDPLMIKDIADVNAAKKLAAEVDLPEKIDEIVDVPRTLAEITEREEGQVKERTIERDFQFIDQSDALLVIYATERSSPGVMSEIIYAHGHDKPVYAVFPYAKSPFLDRYATRVFKTPEEMVEYLDDNPVVARTPGLGIRPTEPGTALAQ